MALEIVDLLAKRLKQEYKLTFANVKQNIHQFLVVIGGSANFESFVERKVEEGKAIGLQADVAKRLASKYGSNVDKLYNIAQIAQDKDLKLPLELYVELVYSVQNEMVFKPTDFLIRRSGKLYFNINEVKQYKDAVVEELAKLLNYTQSQQRIH